MEKRETTALPQRSQRATVKETPVEPQPIPRAAPVSPPAPKPVPEPTYIAPTPSVAPNVPVEQHYDSYDSDPEWGSEENNEPAYSNTPVYVESEPQPTYAPEPEYVEPVRRRQPAPRATINQTRSNDSGFAEAGSQGNQSSYDTDPMDELINSRRSFNESFESPERETEAPKKATRNARATKNSKSKGSPRKNTKEKDSGPGKFAGGRKSVLVVRVIAASVVLGLMGVGVNSMVNPPNIPTPSKVTQAVRTDLNITKFPTAAGNAFVTAFTKEYLTFEPNKRSEKSDALKVFTTDTLASSLVGASGPEVVQAVLEDPVVSGVKSLDNNNAVYTVGAKVNTGWVYLDVPVYYDEKINSFSISGTPSFVSPPVKPEKLPNVEAPYSNDSKLVSTIEGDLSSFFKVWSESNSGEIDRYINKELADVETKSGLQKTVTFVELAQLQVEKKTEDMPNQDTRRAQAKVRWASPAAPKITYEQNYDLVLKLGDQNRWYVADITGGVRATGPGA
jgi:hypothetical protein